MGDELTSGKPDVKEGPCFGLELSEDDPRVLAILRQDDVGGLRVKTRSRWFDAPPVPNSFVCNIGDMLDRLTRGLYRSTPHRVRNVSGRSRPSFPFFFDPSFDADEWGRPGGKCASSEPRRRLEDWGAD